MIEQDKEWALAILNSIGLTEESIRSNISPLASQPNENDSRVGRLLIKHEATSEAILAFDKNKADLTDYAYWYYLSSCWVSYTGFSDLNLWRKLFSSDRPNRMLSIMKPSEVLNYYMLPDELIVYRAKREGEKDWLAYTLDSQIAGKMALQRNVNVVHKYAIKKEDIFALFLRRGEQEVIILDKSKPKLLAEIPVVVTELAPMDS